MFVDMWVADALLSIAERDILELAWSQRVLDEAKGPIPRLWHVEPAAADRFFDALNRAFPLALTSGWESLEDDAELPDVDDRHVLAAARQAGADVIATFNLKHFPAAVLSGFGLVAESPDSLLTGLIDEQPEEVLRIMMDLVSSKKRPPRTMREEISHLRRTGAPLFASRLEALAATR
ncbi:PIN domain-containing protein [Bifidobacterium callitrichos]